MSISMVVGIYTILTLVGITLTWMYIRKNRMPLRLSALHLILTMAGFGVFTAFMATTVPGQSLSWPAISYLLYAVAGIAAFVTIFANKVLSKKTPVWMPASHGLFEILGYTTLLISVMRLY
jgi:hypothetical protein